jgi:hypothetical protein
MIRSRATWCAPLPTWKCDSDSERQQQPRTTRIAKAATKKSYRRAGRSSAISSPPHGRNASRCNGLAPISRESASGAGYRGAARGRFPGRLAPDCWPEAAHVAEAKSHSHGGPSCHSCHSWLGFFHHLNRSAWNHRTRILIICFVVAVPFLSTHWRAAAAFVRIIGQTCGCGVFRLEIIGRC